MEPPLKKDTMNQRYRSKLLEVTMPIYEYRCKNCSHDLEMLQKISDSPLTDCPNCGKNTLEKVISSTQFQLKGTGWYVTDFKDSGKKKEQSPAEKTTTTPTPPVEKKPTSSDS